jgi:hypothetical protein
VAIRLHIASQSTEERYKAEYEADHNAIMEFYREHPAAADGSCSLSGQEKKTYCLTDTETNRICGTLICAEIVINEIKRFSLSGWTRFNGYDLRGLLHMAAAVHGLVCEPPKDGAYLSVVPPTDRETLPKLLVSLGFRKWTPTAEFQRELTEICDCGYHFYELPHDQLGDLAFQLDSIATAQLLPGENGRPPLPVIIETELVYRGLKTFYEKK